MPLSDKFIPDNAETIYWRQIHRLIEKVDSASHEELVREVKNLKALTKLHKPLELNQFKVAKQSEADWEEFQDKLAKCYSTIQDWASENSVLKRISQDDLTFILYLCSLSYKNFLKSIYPSHGALESVLNAPLKQVSDLIKYKTISAYLLTDTELAKHEDCQYLCSPETYPVNVQILAVALSQGFRMYHEFTSTNLKPTKGEMRLFSGLVLFSLNLITIREDNSVMSRKEFNSKLRRTVAGYEKRLDEKLEFFEVSREDFEVSAMDRVTSEYEGTRLGQLLEAVNVIIKTIQTS